MTTRYWKTAATRTATMDANTIPMCNVEIQGGGGGLFGTMLPGEDFALLCSEPCNIANRSAWQVRECGCV